MGEPAAGAELLESLPTDVWTLIAERLDTEDWWNVSMVNKCMYQVCLATRTSASFLIRRPDGDKLELASRSLGKLLRKATRCTHVVFNGSDVTIASAIWAMSLYMTVRTSSLEHVRILSCPNLHLLEDGPMRSVFPGLVEVHLYEWHSTYSRWLQELPCLQVLSLSGESPLRKLALPRELSQVTTLRLAHYHEPVLHDAIALQRLELLGPIWVLFPSAETTMANLVHLRLIDCDVWESSVVALPALRSVYMDKTWFANATTLNALLHSAEHAAFSGRATVSVSFLRANAQQIATDVAMVEAARMRGLDTRIELSKLSFLAEPEQHIPFSFGGPVRVFDPVPEMVNWWVRCCPESVPLECSGDCDFEAIVAAVGSALQGGLQQGQMAALYCSPNRSKAVLPRGPVTVVGLCTGSAKCDWDGLGVREGCYTCWDCINTNVVATNWFSCYS